MVNGFLSLRHHDKTLPITTLAAYRSITTGLLKKSREVLTSFGKGIALHGVTHIRLICTVRAAAICHRG